MSPARVLRGWDSQGAVLLRAKGRKTYSARGLSLQVLKVNLLGHRKRIIASLADRPYEEPPAKPPRFSQLRVSHCLCSLPGWYVCAERARQRPGCSLLPWPSFTFLPVFQRAKPGSVRNNCPLSD